MASGLDILYEDPRLRLAVMSRQDGHNGRTLLSFTGVGHAMGGIDVQRPEFFRTGEAYRHIVFVTDLTRSWGNALDFSLIRDHVAGLTESDTVDALGNSMGGFLALLAPAFLPVRRAVAFAPQFSVHPGLVPWETRWGHYRKAIRDWKYDSLEGRFADTTGYFVFSGDNALDRRQAGLFPVSDNLTMTLLEGFGHDVANDLKQAGVLQELIAACFEGRYLRDWLDTRLVGFRPQRTQRQGLFRRLAGRIGITQSVR